ncbi:MAG: hypothetical protein RBR28_14985 [Lentimicrobium sp.]|jgi:hypothetical protein|nr:hypothetical protein [Lentimicrobium sp.]
MKKRNLILGIALMALGFASCTDKKATQAEESVTAYTDYVDSVRSIPAEEASANWQAIDDSYQLKINNAEVALENLKDKEEAQARIDASKAKYEALQAEVINAVNMHSKQVLRNALFGEGQIGDDMNFSWVNKDNILAVYDHFVATADANKDVYTREDWDEVKLLYEGLDSRKNTVENEGLTSQDNRKIAALKIKFGPMLKFNRMGAKSDEMQEAKK